MAQYLHIISINLNNIIILLIPIHVCACSAAQSRPTLCDPIDYRPPGTSVHGIFQERILE